MPLAEALKALVAMFYIAAGLWLGGLAAPTWAQAPLPVPALTGRVIDSTGTLQPAEVEALTAKLAAFEQRRGAQIVLLMVPTTAPEDIADYAQRVGDSWKIGRRDVGDGLLLLVAKNERRVRIATTKSLEGAIPDLAARQIIDAAITPRFRQGDYAGGLDAAIDQLAARISGENLALPEPGRSGAGAPSGFNWTNLALFVFFGVPVGARLLARLLGRKAGALATGGGVGLLAWLLTSSALLAAGAAVLGLVVALFAGLSSGFGSAGGRRRGALYGGIAGGGFGAGGGLGGGLGGGGFSSGGGGDFGGGGASGSW